MYYIIIHRTNNAYFKHDTWAGNLDSINAVDDTEVQLTCIAINASLVLFEVNGTSASEQSDIDKDLIQLWIENIDDAVQRTNLTPSALTHYNNTEIQCRTIVIGSASQVLSWLYYTIDTVRLLLIS